MEFDELTIKRAEKIRDTVHDLEEFFKHLNEDYESEGDTGCENTGYISTYLIARTDMEQSEIPSHTEINLTLAFLDFHDIMEMEEDSSFLWSETPHNHFHADTYDHSKKEEKIDNLDEAINTYEDERNRISRSEKLNFSDV